MTKLAKRLYAHLKKTSLLPPGTRVLVACSGGPDSLALLLLLLEIAPMRHLSLAAAHYEHGIRGAASKEDAAFVEKFCGQHGVLCYPGAAEEGAIANAPGESMETAARRLRYAFLEEARQAASADVICTAHHADDQAETVLLHLLRGTGLDGLAGIPAFDEKRHLARPLLPFRKEALVCYCTERGVTPRHDATNDVPSGLRNRVRLQLLPELATYNPRIQESLCRLAAIAGEERAALEAEGKWAFSRVVCEFPAGAAGGERGREMELLEGPGLSAKKMQQLPRAIARRVLRRYLAFLGHGTNGSLERLDAILALFTKETGTIIEFPGGLMMMDHGWLRPCRFKKVSNQQES